MTQERETELREKYKKEFCWTSGEFEWIYKDIGSPIHGEEHTDWWLKELSLALEEEEKEMAEYKEKAWMCDGLCK